MTETDTDHLERKNSRYRVLWMILIAIPWLAMLTFWALVIFD